MLRVDHSKTDKNVLGRMEVITVSKWNAPESAFKI